MHTNLRIAQQKPSFNTTALRPELRGASAGSVEEGRFDVWDWTGYCFATSAVCSPTQSQLKPLLFLIILLLLLLLHLSSSQLCLPFHTPSASANRSVRSSFDIRMANLSQSML
ncbi:hypothetical protein LZ30DRAFT_586408 [Colletotrichum cereale]|nr:hypothetical protein LZ30DRAFT_586408 [Colletotrichum cereale]